jgi:hypothetical protein
MSADGRYFAWVHKIQPWAEPRLHPQVIHDVGLYAFKENSVNHQERFTVVAKHVLAEGEYELTIDELSAKYPAPRMQ